MTPFDPRTRRGEALLEAVARIEQEHGKGTIRKLGEAERMCVAATSSGALTLDLALGVGGFPKGRIIEIYGPESGGKTTLSLHAIAEVQKAGGIAAFIDVEHALDPLYAENLGVDVENLLVSQPDDGEQALDITEALARSGAVDLVVVDSVAALVTRAEIEGEVGEAHAGSQARLMSRALRKLTPALGSTGCTLIFVNQVREKIGLPCGHSEVRPGGLALCFYASVRLEVRQAEALKEAGQAGLPLGSRTRVKVVKNKVAPPFRIAEFDIFFGRGIHQLGCVLDGAVAQGLVARSGAWYAYGEQRLGQGRDHTLRLLAAQPALALELEALVRLRCEGDEKSLSAASEAS